MFLIVVMEFNFRCHAYKGTTVQTELLGIGIMVVQMVCILLFVVLIETF